MKAHASSLRVKAQIQMKDAKKSKKIQIEKEFFPNGIPKNDKEKKV